MKFNFPEGFEISCKTCLDLFWICRPCYRGQRYCSKSCRRTSRSESQRQSRRKHQQSPEGRADHRDRQRAYRHRLLTRLSSPVMDQGIKRVQNFVEEPLNWKSARQISCICCGRNLVLKGELYAQDCKIWS